MPGVATKRVTIIGKFNDTQYHKARLTAQDIEQSGRLISVTLVELKPFEFDVYLEQTIGKKYAEELRVHRERSAKLRQSVSPVVLDGDDWLGGIDEFMRWQQINFSYVDQRPFALYKALGSAALKQFLDVSTNTFVFVELSIDGSVAGKIVIELFKSLCPKTVANFESLAVGTSALHYTGSPVHRIVPGGWIQAGDIVGGHGDAGQSTYNGPLADENFIVKHDKFGVVGMANHGPHTNNSQFYITLAAHHWMDTAFVAFGQVFDGYSLLKHLETLPSENERPLLNVIISAAGRYELD